MSRVDRGALQGAIMKSVGAVLAATCLLKVAIVYVSKLVRRRNCAKGDCFDNGQLLLLFFSSRGTSVKRKQIF